MIDYGPVVGLAFLIGWLLGLGMNYADYKMGGWAAASPALPGLPGGDPMSVGKQAGGSGSGATGKPKSSGINLGTPKGSAHESGSGGRSESGAGKRTTPTVDRQDFSGSGKKGRNGRQHS